MNAKEDLKRKKPPSYDARMECDFSIVVGPPKRGKSHLIRWLIIRGMKEGKWDWIVVFSPTKHNGDFKFIEPQSAIHSEFGKFEEVVENLLNVQKDLSIRLGRVPTSGEGRVLLVVDDALGSINWNKPIWTRLASTFRQYGVDCIISTQYIAKLPKCFFSMVTVGYVFRLIMDSDVRYIWDRWLCQCDGTGLKTWEDLKKFMQEKMPIEHKKFLRVNLNTSENPVTLDKAPPKELFEKFIVKLK